METSEKMKGKITLIKPVLINGVEVKEMSYDFEEITVEQFAQADAYKNQAQLTVTNATKKASFAVAPQFDQTLQFYYAAFAILAVNQNWDIEDIRRIKGMDVMRLQTLGANFIAASVAEAQSNSDAQSVDIPENSTQG